MKGYKKIGNTSFREEAIKKMTLKEFKGVYTDILKGQDLDEVYSELTGNKVASKKESAKD